MSGYELPDWVMVNDTLNRLLALRDIYASSPPQEVAYLRGGKVRSGVGCIVGRLPVYEWPAWVMVNDTLDRLLALRDIYASSPPQEVAYLRGGRFKLWVCR